MRVAIKADYNRWKCGYCFKPFNSQVEADKCKDNHDLIYVPLTPTEISRLVNFIYLKEDELIPPGLVEKLQTAMRRASILDKRREV